MTCSMNHEENLDFPNFMGKEVTNIHENIMSFALLMHQQNASSIG